jgi:hypothetical protein
MLVGISASIIDIPLMREIQKEIEEENIDKVFSYWLSIDFFGGFR